MRKKQTIGWKDFEKFVLFVGCHFTREKGDHRVFWREDLKRPLVFPRDNPLPVFVIRNNLRILNMPWNEFLKIMERL